MRERLPLLIDVLLAVGLIAAIAAHGCGQAPPPPPATGMVGAYDYAATLEDGGPLALCADGGQLAGALHLLNPDGAVLATRWTGCSIAFGGEADVIGPDQISVDLQVGGNDLLATLKYSAGALYGPIEGRGVKGLLSAKKPDARGGKILDDPMDRR
jgi:hypothetical protein